MSVALAAVVLVALVIPVSAQEPAATPVPISPEVQKKIDRLRGVPVMLSAIPKDATMDPATWPGVANELVGALMGVRSGAVDDGDEMAKLLIRVGVCADNDEPCPIKIAYEISMDKDAKDGIRRVVIRYIIVSETGRTERFAQATKLESGEVDKPSYWVRNGAEAVWRKLAPGAEYEAEGKAVSTFLSFVLDQKGDSAPKPKPVG